MRTRTTRAALSLTLLGATLLGCASDGSSSGADGQRAQADEPREVDQDLMEQIEQTARDLERLERGEAGEGGEADAPSEPVVADGSEPRSNLSPTVEIEREEPDAETGAPAEQTAAQKPERRAEPSPAQPSVAERVRAAASDLATLLRADAEADPVRVYAALAALELVRPGSLVNPSSIEGLTPEEARVLESWADLMREADARLTSSPRDARALAGALVEAAAGAGRFEPLRIEDALLCSRVEGFGRYTTMSGRWMAGGAHKAIVYVEVDNFGTLSASGPGGVSGYETQLTQELLLYHDNDGLLAWRQPPQDVSDFSRRRREDFFLVQMIELPSNLSVGRYRLKVSVRDRVSGDEAEAIIPIQIVADPTLLADEPRGR